ncbi:glycosyltransferase family 4 protein [Microbacterium sp. ASV49]|uniref:Glycosyltransferase family 1 protein n=1 Tax=Microbacterium candidum TaxID=3041922 RepID=A0ABT7MV19_9MICO|nr:glycosyltransferase family 1 protein [Microbacterium sp. ASV49]MDL9978273.1 glycosyltransferase family 1 protein [Microbacterium sp. ASV49]
MPTLTLATTASANPMGAQRYERELVTRAPQSLPGWAVRHEVFRSLRSPLDGTRRIPIGWLARAEGGTRRSAGALLYPAKAGIVHRMDLVLPPSRHGDVVTIHDTVAWDFDDESAPIGAAAAEARAADAVICVSEFTADAVRTRLGVRDPVVIPNGVDDRFFEAALLPRGPIAALGITGPYILHAGGASKRKNLEALAEAWPIVRREFPDLTLVLAGPPHPRRTELFSGVASVRLLGKVPDAVMPELVHSAEAVVIPSLYEGFGLPALEAMAAGTPVVAADTSALTEVVADSGVLVAPDASGVSRGVIDLLRDAAFAEDLRRRGSRRATAYTWDACAAAHARVWSAIGG